MRTEFLARAVVSAILFTLPALGPAQAQTLSVLHSFAGNDGANPCGGLALSGTTFYGAAFNGGSGGNGTVFSVGTNGGSFSVLYAFTSYSASHKTDGALPNGDLVLSGSTLYGTTTYGGGTSSTLVDQGTLFSLTTSKTYTTLYYFTDLQVHTGIDNGTNTDGVQPVAGPVLAGGRLYGTASYGGFGGNGTVFSHPTAASQTTLSVLHQFSAGSTADDITFTNTDGATPYAPLLLVGGTLYGTTYTGGTNGMGVVFKVNTNGTSFQVLHHCGAADANPTSDLVLSGTNLYGLGGNVLFRLSTNNGAGFTIVHEFGDSVGSTASGASPGLSLSGNTLFAAVDGDNSLFYGQIAALGTDGSAFSDYHDFSPTAFIYNTNADGAFPNGGLLWLNGSLFGTAVGGGMGANGVLFVATPPFPSLSCQRSGGNFTLSFMTQANVSYTVLQSTTLAHGSWTTFTNCLGSGSVTQFTKSTAAATRFFFRLRQP